MRVRPGCDVEGKGLPIQAVQARAGRTRVRSEGRTSLAVPQGCHRRLAMRAQRRGHSK